MNGMKYESWEKALSRYSYPVNLVKYDEAAFFPNYFRKNIQGDRQSTIEFENYFRDLAPKYVEVYFEVVFWKLFSQGSARQKITTRIIDNVQNEKTTAEEIWNVIQAFVENQNKVNFEKMRNKLGIQNGLAVTLTFPAFAYPDKIPMIDRHIAEWVNENGEAHNINRKNKLSNFENHKKPLQTNDFSNYLKWVSWCQEMSQVLTEMTGEHWRARDVEMAVFTAHRNNMTLNVLP